MGAAGRSTNVASSTTNAVYNGSTGS